MTDWVIDLYKTLHPLQLWRGVQLDLFITPKFTVMFIIITLANVFSNEQYDM